VHHLTSRLQKVNNIELFPTNPVINLHVYLISRSDSEVTSSQGALHLETWSKPLSYCQGGGDPPRLQFSLLADKSPGKLS
jgi:hypothetical protein